MYNFREFSDLSRSVSVPMTTAQLAGTDNVTVALNMSSIVSSQLFIPGGQFYFETCTRSPEYRALSRVSGPLQVCLSPYRPRGAPCARPRDAGFADDASVPGLEATMHDHHFVQLSGVQGTKATTTSYALAIGLAVGLTILVLIMYGGSRRVLLPCLVRVCCRLTDVLRSPSPPTRAHGVPAASASSCTAAAFPSASTTDALLARIRAG